MYRNLILFGAGASFGSDTFSTPPLGCQLFSELARFNPPGWGNVPDELIEIFEEDFERGMAKVPEFNAHWMPVLQRAMAAYFFNFVPSTSNLYYQLATRISGASWDGACATLNYERLLELSLRGAAVRPVVGCEPNDSSQVELILPHGCCHIFCDAVQGNARGVSFSGVGITTNGRVSVVANPAQFQARINSDAFPPVMSYFEPGKRTNTGASFIAGQRQRWNELARSATAIAIVGVGVRSEDSHIWQPVSESEATIIYCSGGDGAALYRDWAEQEGKLSSSLILEGFFADEFDNICGRLEL